MPRPPLPPFTVETAMQKVRMAEDAWNTRDPERVALAYTEDSWWRNRAQFFQGGLAIIQLLHRKARLLPDQGALGRHRQPHRGTLPVRMARYSGSWYRADGNEQWEFTAEGLMRRREAGINDVPIREADRLFISLCTPSTQSRPHHPGGVAFPAPRLFSDQCPPQ